MVYILYTNPVYFGGFFSLQELKILPPEPPAAAKGISAIRFRAEA